jgi:hypothetical protein
MGPNIVQIMAIIWQNYWIYSDWLVFSATISNISAIWWREQILCQLRHLEDQMVITYIRGEVIVIFFGINIFSDIGITDIYKQNYSNCTIGFRNKHMLFLICFLRRTYKYNPNKYIVSWHLLGHAIKSVTCFDLQFSRSTRPMTSFCIFIAYINTEGILLNFKITRWD